MNDFQTKTNLRQRYEHLLDNGTKKDQLFADFEYGWRNGGILRDGTQFTIGDAIALSKDTKFADAISAADMPMWIPRVINTQIREAIEPVLVGEKLLNRIQFQAGQQVSVGALSAIAGDFEVSDMGELPEVKINYSEGTTIRTTGRSGLALRFAPDILRYSVFPAIELHVKAAARALARYKEEKIFTTIGEEGQIVFDNDTPADSELGSTTGRGFTGAANGSMTAEDWMDLFHQVMKNGFMPRGVLMNTMAYMAFMKDPYMKWMGMNNGSTMWGSYTGSPVASHDWPNLSGLGMGNGQFSHPANAANGEDATELWQFPSTNAAPVFPSYFWGAPINIIVSPFVNYDVDTGRGDIIVFDPAELGYLVVEHDLQMKDFTNPETDIYTIKMDERYSILISNEGQGVAVAKGISFNPGNQIITPAQTTIAVNADELTEIDQTVSPYASVS